MRFLLADLKKTWTSDGVEAARKSTAGG